MALSVTRTRQSLVRPWEKTPLTRLDLSVMDKIPVLRCMARTVHVYRYGNDEGAGCRVIREALSRALVPYYPLGGRLIQSAAELQVECCGQGVWLVEAYTSATLHSLNYLEHASSSSSSSSSIPYDYDDLLPPDHHHHFSESQSQLGNDEPLVQMQVTGFACGGLVMGLKFSHTICDGLGAAQFLKAVGELARGLEQPSIAPVWHRHFIASSTNSTGHCQNIDVVPNYSMIDHRLEQTNIDISIDNINKLKQEFEESTGGHRRRCSVFEIVAASFWRCRTQAILNQTNNNKQAQVMMMTLVFFANCRHLMEPPLPEGFYGNCFFPVVVKAPSEWLAGPSTSVVDVVKLVQEAKAKLPNQVAKYLNKRKQNNTTSTCTSITFNSHSDESDDHQGDIDDPFAPPLGYTTLFLSEWGRLGFNQVDFGWGSPLHIVPIQGSSFIPAGIMGCLPFPNKGVRLMTWCVDEAHRQPFIHHMIKLFP
ncbi:acyl transferase 4 [Ziziphus jujuba]|uniref:Acyl transferase 4 n=2 Tax=Ziziphus jujuba TaxID=326968 RepID=A0A6P4ARQ9_ZIZJJ|nr:acyl transferase 4 [Ziziphus jujuba]KAH7516915.1 hypothetical protein FEM48_Zijuj09G0006100 [Ziziphus jujuba var. spinosa]